MKAMNDGNTETDDGCNANCSAVAQGFICETEGMLCFSTCGDGILASDEVCDDNNTANDDGCSADCMQVGAIDCTENETGLSACNDSCGDGVRETLKNVTWVQRTIRGACGAWATMFVGRISKGDGIINGGEVCDDSNDAAGDDAPQTV